MKPRDMTDDQALMAMLDEHAVPSSDDLKLIEASRQGDLEAVKGLLAGGADINAEEPGEVLRYDTPLMAASRGHLDIVKLLLAEGADVNRRSFEETPLTVACGLGHADIAQWLIAKGARVNVDDQFIYETPLMKACRGHIDLVKLLIDRGAHVNPKGFHLGKTPLTVGCAGGHAAIVKLLLEGRADTNPKIASDDGSPGVNVIYPPLACGTRSNSLEIVRMLLAKGARVDAKDLHGRTALTYAVSPDPSVCLPDDAFDVVSALVDGGADVNTQLVTKSDYDNGYTPLMLACRHRSPYHSLRAIEFLLDRGADIQMKNSKGQTALTIASDKSPDVVELIQSKSGD
jgi:ankyrin repeat protein